VVVWLNGTRGADKATTAGELVELLADARAFNAVEVG
jgi:adenylylsulfate kinase-like enzyme